MGVRVAIAHDYLTQRGGAERVVLSMLKAFPDAEIHTTLFHPAGTFPEFRSAVVRTSWLNAIKPFRHRHRWALPLLPFAVNSMHIDADVVLISSSGWAHGVRTAGRTVAYCHTPARWLYAEADYLRAGRTGLKSRLLAVLRRPLLAWDQRSARSVDVYLANSEVSQRRILAAYGLEAPVVHPPHIMDRSLPLEPATLPVEWGEHPAFVLTVSRLMAYKNVDAVIAAAADAGHRLVVVGSGPDRTRLKAGAGENTVFLEDVDDAQLRWLYSHAMALVAASLEDLGLTPIEAAAFGTPTIALRAGGYLETVVDGVNGLFFDEPSVPAIADALQRARRVSWSAETIRRSADRFEEQTFIATIRDAVRSVAGDTA